MLYVCEFEQFIPWRKCRILVVVDENGHCKLQEYLDELAVTRPVEYKKIMSTLRRVVSRGPRDIHDEGMCKIVGEVGEFKARNELLRVFWFFADFRYIRSLRVDTIVLTHIARPNKGQEQDREIRRAEEMAAQYRRSPFIEYEKRSNHDE